ncbi:PhzF family phenazine biosynthesis protein [Listeria fleischmannii]|nr:phenazine biosynthesis protein PhzF family [Listeria fleischmannii subsp. fleischmannii LU2006-1]
MNYFIVDAFASKPFEGNPAAVFVLNSWLTDELMPKNSDRK